MNEEETRVSPLAMIENHPCPECGNKIGLHHDSVFSTNPEGKDGKECSRSHHSLIIDMLEKWLDDAIAERDAYMKSYERAAKDSSDYFNAFANMTAVASEAAQDRDNYKRKLDYIARKLDGWYVYNYHDVGLLINDIIKEIKG